ncbi:MAG: GNAT family N-acetyltransferase [Rhodobacteraceae bacterium]|nr:GNAT family N-acetyltransferase [Paracoccaceae bacterium]
MTDRPVLRRARPEDGAAAEALLAGSAGGGGGPDGEGAAAGLAGRIAAAPGLVWLAEAGGALAGVAAAREDGVVTLLHVAAAARGRGLGTLLLRRIEAELAARGLAEARAEPPGPMRAFCAARGWDAGAGADVDGRAGAVMRKLLPAVRRLAAHEADLWRRIRLNALAAAPSAFAERHDDWADRPLGDFAERLASASVFLAELGGAGVGCIELTPDAGGAPGRGWVESVFVTRLARGRGVADALLAAVEAEARRRGLTELCLDVGAANAAARALYARFGFAEMAERPAGSGCGCEITMRRTLACG